MIITTRTSSILLVALGLASGLASAEPTAGGRPLATVQIPTQPHAMAAGTLYLNRCIGGCTIHKSGINDARSHSSTIPEGSATDYVLSEFAWGDQEWNDIVTCMKEVYSPYAVAVTDQPPAPGLAYNEAIIAGSPSEIGRGGIGGIAPVTGDCSVYNYVINFTFANNYGPNDRVFQLCAVAAQESGHSYGLDHTYAFIDGTSGCRDPMTYRGDCGGQKFFRNEQAICGEFSPRACSCGSNQNSHLKLLSGLGEGTPITRAPVVTVKSPAPDATIASGTTVIATASAQRGIKTVELWLNGYKWGEAKGAKWGANGQPESDYGIPLPADVPDGVIDIVIKAKDDIDVTTTAPTVTVTKGAPCTTADTCADGQRCDAGRCLWDAPVGELGDDCTFSQYCLTGICSGTDAQRICTQNCVPGVADSCPSEFACAETGPGKGICFFGDSSCDGGCCGCTIVDASAGQGLATGGSLAVIGLLGVFVLRPRRRTR